MSLIDFYLIAIFVGIVATEIYVNFKYLAITAHEAWQQARRQKHGIPFSL